MTLPGSGIILTLFFSLVMLSGCDDGQSNAGNGTAAVNLQASNSDAPKSNVEELSMLVHVPYEAEDIVWKQDPINRNIVAVFRFSQEDAAKLVAEAERAGSGKAVSVPVEAWYPDELVAQGEMSGDSTLKGTTFPANMFFQEPYNMGRITRVEGVDYFILEISAK